MLILAGGGSWIYGNHLNNDMNAVLNSFFGSGSVFVILGMIGVILGVILLICGIVRKNTNVVRGNRVVEQMGIDCPLCRFVNSPNRTTCERCGRELPTNHLENKPKRIPCDMCQTENEADSTFCKGCGISLKVTK